MDWRGSTPRKRATNPEDKYAAAIKSVEELPSLIFKSSLSIIIAHASSCKHVIVCAIIIDNELLRMRLGSSSTLLMAAAYLSSGLVALFLGVKPL